MSTGSTFININSGASVTFGVYIGLAGLLMVILLWVLFTKCHLR